MLEHSEHAIMYMNWWEKKLIFVQMIDQNMYFMFVLHIIIVKYSLEKRDLAAKTSIYNSTISGESGTCNHINSELSYETNAKI